MTNSSSRPSRPRSVLAMFVAPIAAVVLVGCDSTPPPADPCQAETYNAAACQDAVSSHGYYWYGAWHPLFYPYPYSWYATGYNTYVVAHPGFVPMRTASQFYSPSFSSSAFHGGTGTVRGGFGEIGAAHASGSFGG